MRTLARILLNLFMLLMAYLMIVGLPVTIYHEHQCIKKGYPKSYTTFTLEGYCMGVEGSNSKVVKL